MAESIMTKHILANGCQIYTCVRRVKNKLHQLIESFICMQSAVFVLMMKSTIIICSASVWLDINDVIHCGGWVGGAFGTLKVERNLLGTGLPRSSTEGVWTGSLWSRASEGTHGLARTLWLCTLWVGWGGREGEEEGRRRDRDRGRGEAKEW